jgi:para-nitrobenzyl esterase
MLNPASYYATQGRALLHALLIADGTAGDDAGATAYVATQTSARVAEYMRSRTPATILSALLTKLGPLGLSGSGPIPDGTVLPADPIAAVAAGDYARVPVLAGTTRDEGKLFASFLALSPALGGAPGLVVSDAGRFTMMYDFDPDGATALSDETMIAPRYLPVDAPETGYDAKTALLTRIFFGASRDDVLGALRKRQPEELWHYEFDWALEPAPWNHVYGAAHLFDVPFVFGNFGPSLIGNVIGGRANERGRLALSSAMMASLGAFARNGDPNAAALGVNWPNWPSTLVFDATLTDKKISVR